MIGIDIEIELIELGELLAAMRLHREEFAIEDDGKLVLLKEDGVRLRIGLDELEGLFDVVVIGHWWLVLVLFVEMLEGFALHYERSLVFLDTEEECREFGMEKRPIILAMRLEAFCLGAGGDATEEFAIDEVKCGSIVIGISGRKCARSDCCLENAAPSF